MLNRTQQPLNNRCWKGNKDYMQSVLRQANTLQMFTCPKLLLQLKRNALRLLKQLYRLELYPSKNHSPLLPSLLLNLQTAQVPLLRQSLPVYCLFHEPPLSFLKIDFFSEPPKFSFFLSLNPIPSFKSN